MKKNELSEALQAKLPRQDFIVGAFGDKGAAIVYPQGTMTYPEAYSAVNGVAYISTVSCGTFVVVDLR